MSKNELDWVTCKIALGGDIRNVLFRSEHEPVSVPELDVLSVIHGENSLSEITYCATTLTSPVDEKIRLLSKYSDKVVNEIFPGRNPNMNMLAPDRPAPAPASAASDDAEVIERAKAAAGKKTKSTE